MKSLRPLLVLALVSVLPIAVTACDFLKKKGAEDAGATPAETAAPVAADPSAPVAPVATALSTITPATGNPHPFVAKKLPDGGVVLVNASDGGVAAATNPFAIPSTFPSNFPKTLPSGFPSSLPSGFPTTLPSGFPQFPAPAASVKK
jgi:glucose/arabinose dehydrogenase